MYNAFNMIFWGTLITFLNINIGWLNLFPNFIGYILIAAGLSKIIALNTDNKSNARKANSLAWILAIYSFAVLFAKDAFGGVTLSVLSSVFMTVDMIMSYFILSSAVNDENREAISKQQRNYLVMVTAAIASSCVAIMIPGILWVTLVFSFASKIYFIYLCQVIKRQYKVFVSENGDASL